MHRSTREAFELSLLLADHDIDPLTGYCRACGQAEGHILAHNLQCFRAPNIVAFSHRRAAQRLEQSIEASRQIRKKSRHADVTYGDWLVYDEAGEIDWSVLQDLNSWALSPDEPA